MQLDVNAHTLVHINVSTIPGTNKSSLSTMYVDSCVLTPRHYWLLIL